MFYFFCTTGVTVKKNVCDGVRLNSCAGAFKAPRSKMCRTTSSIGIYCTLRRLTDSYFTERIGCDEEVKIVRTYQRDMSRKTGYKSVICYRSVSDIEKEQSKFRDVVGKSIFDKHLSNQDRTDIYGTIKLAETDKM